MDLSIFIAKIIALLYIPVGLGVLLGKVNLKKIVDNFIKNPALELIAGLNTMLLGMIVITYHNLWVQDWPVIITIFGWLATIKGVFFIGFPGFIKYFKPWYKKEMPWAILMIIVGIVFGYFGFMV